MKKMSVLSIVVLGLLGGCATVNEFTDKHPTATKVIIGSVFLSAGYSVYNTSGKGSRSTNTGPTVEIPATPGCYHTEACK